jgi:uncharacterized protein YjiS (DUF1127 family)
MDRLLPRRETARLRLGRIAAILSRISRAFECARQRRALSGLSDEMLRDLGLTRDDVARESAKPFWR